MATKKITLNIPQRLWLGLSVITSLGGLTLGILGTIRDFISGPLEDNWIVQAESAMNEFLETSFSWQIWGTLFLVLGAVIFTLLMNRVATLETLAKEKAIRRAQRLQDTSLPTTP
jgi:hypothetical protein